MPEGNIERWAAEHEPIRQRGWTGDNVLSFCYAVPGGANEIAVVLNQHAGVVEALDRLRRAADAWDAALSSYCDGPERDDLRAASLTASRFGGQ